MKKKYLFILIIAIITLFTRFVGLNKIPPHLSNDEISIAYDAYSISRTQRDEHNQYLPMSFQSHGTFKAPLSIYLTSLSVSLLGNSEFAARLPSALLGGFSVILMGLIVYELTKKVRLALFASLITSITPWHIYTSRMILESNIALFFLLLGLWIFLKSLRTGKGLHLITSFTFFAMSMYSYHTEWGLVPLVIATLLAVYRKKLFINKNVFIGLTIFIILILPLFLDFLNNVDTNARANTQLLFTQGSFKDQINKYQNNYFKYVQIIFSRFIATYSSYTEPDKIFFESPNLLPKKDPFQTGLILAPFLPMFIYGLLKVKKYFKQNTVFIYILLLISPITPALTVGEQLVVRNLPFLVPLIIIISLGCYELYTRYYKNKILTCSFAAFVVVSFFYFCVIYFYHFPREMSVNFQYGYKQIAEFIKPRYEKYNKIVLDPTFGEGYVYTGVPHLYIPYFTYLDPSYLQERGGVEGCGNCFAKYEIRRVKWDEEVLLDDSLYIVPNSNRPPQGYVGDLSLIYEIKYLDRTPAFDIYNTDNINMQ